MGWEVWDWGGSSGSCSWCFGVWNPAVEVSSDPSRAVIWGGRVGWEVWDWGVRFGIGVGALGFGGGRFGAGDLEFGVEGLALG